MPGPSAAPVSLHLYCTGDDIERAGDLSTCDATPARLLCKAPCEEDWSNASPDDKLPDAVAAGAEPFLVVGAMAGG